MLYLLHLILADDIVLVLGILSTLVGERVLILWQAYKNNPTAILQEIRRRGLKVIVAGIPKTIDNDIPVILFSSVPLDFFFFVSVL